MAEETFEDLVTNTSSGMATAVSGLYEELPPLPEELKPKTPEQQRDIDLPVE